MQVAPGVYAIRATGSTVYLLGGIELTLIDAGGPGSRRGILRYIQRLQHQPSDLTRIFLTHLDMDHVGGLPALIEATGAHVLAHPETLERLAAGEMPLGNRGLRSYWVALRRLLTPQHPVQMTTEPLIDGVTLPALDGLEVIYSGGHSPDHVVYFGRQSRLLFAGDLLEVVRGHLQAQPGSEPEARQQTVQALRRLADLDPLVILPGHGLPYRNNIALRLVRLAEILEE